MSIESDFDREKGKGGESVASIKHDELEGAVEEKSPAGAAGLKKGDIIIEINGVNITRENHAQIVARIKASGDCTLFLVADQECKARCFIFPFMK